MTLDTHIRVMDPVPFDELWSFCNRLIGGGEATITRDTWPTHWRAGVEHEEPTFYRVRRNRIDQGLVALLWAEYAVERPFTEPDDPEDVWGPYPYFVEIDFNSPYGYRGKDGHAGCSDLHAAIVERVGQWLEARGKRYQWQQEFTSDWYESWLDSSKLGDARLGHPNLVAAEHEDHNP